MQRALFIASLSLCGCRAIVGSYEVGPTTDAGTDTTVNDAGVDAIVPNDASDANDAADVAAGVSSCKELLAKTPTTPSGPYVLTLKSTTVTVFCDMQMRGGGYTLVALKSSKTDATPWTGGSVAKRTSLSSPHEDVDAVLDVDWREIGFDEVLYDLGDAPPPTHATFTMNDTYRAAAKDALFAWSTSPGTDHPACTVEPGTTPYGGCSPPPPPPGDPPSSIGWLYSPTYATTGKLCWWGIKGSNGAQNCSTGVAGTGRVWVK